MRLPYVIDNEEHRLADVGGADLLAAVEALSDEIGASEEERQAPSRQGPLGQEDLHLVCFELVTG